MLDEMTNKVWQEWIRFYSVDPFGESRGDLRAALICSTFANSNREKGKPVYKIKDFLLEFEKPKTKTPEQLLDKLFVANAMFDGEVKKIG